MPKANGYAIVTDPGTPRGVQEMDTFTCAHCQTIVFLHNRDGTRKADQGGMCMPCFKPVCGPCADNGTCTPFEKKLRESEARANSRRSLFRELGR